MSTFYFYFARCSDGSLYSGSCNNLINREKRHNAGEGANYTKIRRPVKVIYSEEYPTLVEARRRERQVKGWSKIKKEKLVTMKDLK